MTKKKSTPRLQVDQSITGAVLPCPLCAQRFMEDDAARAWRALYKHLRFHHDHRNAAELTHKVRMRIQRMNWEIRHKTSNGKEH